MSTGINCTSPVRSEMPSLISFLNPEDTETETIMMREETAMETIAILPPKRRRPAMNLDASKIIPL